jgi:lambda repressor-like predicted transcriptional regulator
MAASFCTEPARRLLLALADAHNITLTEVGDVLGLPRRTLHRVLASSRLRWDAADRVAVALGHHPSELWPDWFDAAPAQRRRRQRVLRRKHDEMLPSPPASW